VVGAYDLNYAFPGHSYAKREILSEKYPKVNRARVVTGVAVFVILSSKSQYHKKIKAILLLFSLNELFLS
jgi:hypothetical protein